MHSLVHNVAKVKQLGLEKYLLSLLCKDLCRLYLSLVIKEARNGKGL